MSTHQNEVIEEHIPGNCEYDCARICVGCDRFFHEIKTKHGYSHDEELPGYIQLNCGDYYCHDDCYRDGL